MVEPLGAEVFAYLQVGDGPEFIARFDARAPTRPGEEIDIAIMTDRIPILFGIAALYFGYVTTSWSGAAALFVAVATPLVATIRQRQGLALALDYLSRVYFRDPSDEIHATT